MSGKIERENVKTSKCTADRCIQLQMVEGDVYRHKQMSKAIDQWEVASYCGHVRLFLMSNHKLPREPQSVLVEDPMGTLALRQNWAM